MSDSTNSKDAVVIEWIFDAAVDLIWGNVDKPRTIQKVVRSKRLYRARC